MRICTQKETGELIEMQSDATEGTLINNALLAGYKESEIEERVITEAEWGDPQAPWNLPSDEQLKSQAESTRQSLFAEYDLAIKMLERAQRLGDATAAAKIAPWDEYAVALQAMNDEPDWYRNPQWPEKPE